MHKNLPIDQHLDNISHSLASSNSLVLQAEPGAGKSTAVPLSLIDAGWLNNKKIVMLEPRRVAAKSIALYLAKLLGEPVGKRVGYQIRNEKKVSRETVLEIVTEGILTRRIQNDPELTDIGLIIFDEFHERSIHTDLSLMLATEIQSSLREDLKLLVMSATLDSKMIASYLGGASVIQCEGRCYPVQVQYEGDVKTKLVDRVLRALKTVLDSGRAGDILVFLPGQADIKKCFSRASERFKSVADTSFHMLYGGLSITDQEAVLNDYSEVKRRVVFATNIAETSLTIHGITTVIDSGLEKVLTYDPESSMTRLDTELISKASAEQRRGRAGRLSEGLCIRLWSESKQSGLHEYQEPEVLSADLSSVVLDLALWGTYHYQDIHWLTAPPEANFKSAQALLCQLGLLRLGQRGEQATGLSSIQLTNRGREAVNIGAHPRLASMLLQAQPDSLCEKVMAGELAALLSERDIFLQQSNVDLFDRLLAIQAFKENPENRYPVKRGAVQQLLNNANSYLRSLSEGRSLQSSCNKKIYAYQDIKDIAPKLLFYAFPDRLAKLRPGSLNKYLLANGRGVFLFESDSLVNADWLIVSDCDGQKREGRIYSAVKIEPSLVSTLISDHVHNDIDYQLDSKKTKIIGRKLTHYGAIEILNEPVQVISNDDFQQVLLGLFKKEGLSLLNWTDGCQQWLQRANWLGRNLNHFPLLCEEKIVTEIDSWLMPYISHVNSLEALKKVNLLPLLQANLDWDQQQQLEKEAPVLYQAPSGKMVDITYDFQQGPTVSIQLQEMFGELVSPLLAAGKVPLRFELLSPARRPIQTTSDLENFWKSSYVEVAKEMRGRYPKHRWPEQPLLEKPGKSIKRK